MVKPIAGIAAMAGVLWMAADAATAKDVSKKGKGDPVTYTISDQYSRLSNGSGQSLGFGTQLTRRHL